MCLSARCVPVCCCIVGTSAQVHLAGTALLTPVQGHTVSVGPTAPCVLRCTIGTLSAVLHCLVPCTALHCVCRAAPHLRAVGSGSVAMHCNTACGQGAVELLQLSAALPVGSGHRKSCNALPHVWGQWAVELLQCTAKLPRGSGQCNSCNALPHYLRAVGTGTSAMHRQVWCGVVWCAKGAVTERQRPGCLPTGTGKRAGLCVLCARCV